MEEEGKRQSGGQGTGEGQRGGRGKGTEGRTGYT